MHDRVDTISNRSSYEGVSTGSISNKWLGDTYMKWGCKILKTRIKPIDRRRTRIAIGNGWIVYKRISLAAETLQFISVEKRKDIRIYSLVVDDIHQIPRGIVGAMIFEKNRSTNSLIID